MKTIINFCPTGMIPTKAMNPSAPISVAEIVEQTHEAYEIGITIVHLHARDKDESPTYKASIYRDIIEGVRKHCPSLIVCASTSGRNFPDFEKRSEVIELKPDMCSLTLSSLNFMHSASINTPDMVQALICKMMDHGVHPELECFDLGMINYGKYLLKKYQLGKACYWNLIFGNIAGFQANFHQIGAAVQEIPSDHYIGMGGIGNSQLKTATFAIAAGLGVRIGMEDNIWYDQHKKTLATNTALVKRVHTLMEIHESTLMPASELKLFNYANAR